MSKTVLGVGHCGYDSGRIAHVVESLGGVFEGVATLDAALALLKSGDYAVVLPNRVIGFDEEGGLKVVQAIKADPALQGMPVCLVSGIAEAQAAAEAAGAAPGFGKDQLENGGAAAVLKPYL